MPSAAFRRFYSASLVALLLCLPSGRAVAQTPPAANPQVVDSAELWRRGSDQALAGDFASAARSFERVLQLNPSDAQAQRALTWVNDGNDLARRRESLRVKTFQQHVDAAQQLMQREKWSKAIDQLRLAEYNANSPAEIRALPFFDQLVQRTEEQITRHREKNEWLDALVLYAILGKIYEGTPREQQYEQEEKFCRQRAHFEAMYAKDADWQPGLADIRTEIVEEAFRRVDREHFEEPDFKKITLGGLDNILVMAETPSLADVFEQLKDKTRAGDFVARLKGEIDRVQRRGKLDRRDAVDYFNRLMNINRQTLNLKSEVMAYEFLSGAMTPLDEFTSIIWPSEVDDFEKHTHGEFTGVGIQITKPDGQYIRVETPLEDSPAFDAGVSPGDLIIAVDGRSTKNMKLNDAVRQITGPEDSKVKLTLERPGQTEPFELNLPRKKIKIRSVKGMSRTPDGSDWDFMIDPEHKIGYVRISQFTNKTVDELRAALEQLRRRGGRGLIMDLRFNPGGLLTSAVQTCELFLDRGQPVVKTEGRNHSDPRPYEASSNGDFRDTGPIVILVNEQSASASEIVSGTLSGNGKAFVIGERSFGKGSVQNLYEIADRSAYFKLTTALYYVPEDPLGNRWRCLHHNPGDKEWGVEPDMQVKLIPNEITRVWELRRQQEMIAKDGSKPPKGMLDRPRTPTTQPDEDIVIPNEAPEVDPQLETALSVMRLKLVSKQPWVFAPRVPAHAQVDTPKGG